MFQRPFSTGRAAECFPSLPLRLVGALVLLGTGSALAAPVQYSFDDSRRDRAAGSGVFTLDVGPVLMDYDASSVVGAGPTFGTWDAVTFHANPGGWLSLTISNLVAAEITYSFPAIGGSDIQPGSRGDLEWSLFISEAAVAGVQIAPVTTGVPGVPVVPESSTWASVIGFALAVAGARLGRRNS